MIVLGIECSSKQGSVVLLKNGEMLAKKTWIAERIRHNVIFQNLETLFREARISYDAISLYAVGRGPGSFSGMRMGFAVAQALALPTKTEVRAVSSGAALALAVARKTDAGQIIVTGDARRGRVWIGFFEIGEHGTIHCLRDWTLVPYREAIVPQAARVVSPEADRLKKYFPTIGTSVFPHAKEVAELASAQTAIEPLEPLYMHPPVFVEPKYNR